MNQPDAKPMTRTYRGLRLLALLFLLALAAAVAVWQRLQSLDLGQVHVMVDGGEVLHGAALANLSPGQQLLAVSAIGAVGFALIITVPVLLLALAIVVLPMLLLALGLPLVLVLSIGALLVAPLALVGLLCWWLIRSLLRDNPPLPSATMTG